MPIPPLPRAFVSALAPVERWTAALASARSRMWPGSGAPSSVPEMDPIDEFAAEEFARDALVTGSSGAAERLSEIP